MPAPTINHETGGIFNFLAILTLQQTPGDHKHTKTWEIQNCCSSSHYIFGDVMQVHKMKMAYSIEIIFVFFITNLVSVIQKYKPLAIFSANMMQ
jgi:hypothetical protein